MTLNTVKPRSAIRRLSPSMVCATDLLLGLVMTPSEDCVLSSIRASFRSKAQLCPAARAGRCLILVQECVLARRTLHPPSGGAAAPRLFDRITVADAPEPARRKRSSCLRRSLGCLLSASRPPGRWPAPPENSAATGPGELLPSAGGLGRLDDDAGHGPRVGDH